MYKQVGLVTVFVMGVIAFGTLFGRITYSKQIVLSQVVYEKQYECEAMYAVSCSTITVSPNNDQQPMESK